MFRKNLVPNHYLLYNLLIIFTVYFFLYKLKYLKTYMDGIFKKYILTNIGAKFN